MQENRIWRKVSFGCKNPSSMLLKGLPFGAISKAFKYLRLDFLFKKIFKSLSEYQMFAVLARVEIDSFQVKLFS